MRTGGWPLTSLEQQTCGTVIMVSLNISNSPNLTGFCISWKPRPFLEKMPSPNGAGVSVVVDVKQSLKISYGVSAPGRENRDMSAADLVGEGNLLRDYLLKMMIKAESVLTELIGEGVCREIGPGGKA